MKNNILPNNTTERDKESDGKSKIRWAIVNKLEDAIDYTKVNKGVGIKQGILKYK